jgi:hypothetical protein
MSRIYEGHGIRFEYPDDWLFHEQALAEEVTLTVQSPDSAYWSLTLVLDRPDPVRVVEAALNAFREEYSEVDVYPCEVELHGQPTEARDLDFICHDLIGSAFVRAIQTPQLTLLVLYQVAELELETARPLLDKITQSLSWDTEPPTWELDEPSLD